MILFAVISSVAYALFILFCTFSWLKLKQGINSSANSISLSIVIAVRNEAQNILNLLQSISIQFYDIKLVEVIIVNDHSTDKTKEIVLQFKSQSELNISVIDLPEKASGKKIALNFGINNATHPLVITTDADCTVGKDWLKNISCNFDAEKTKMLVMPVAVQANNFFAFCQALEFMSLQALTASFIGGQFPIMCNGANLAFTKEAYKEVENSLEGKNLLSGDDTFLMLAIKKRYGRDAIKYVKSPEVVVKTKACNNVKEFFHQRIRWASKVKHYKSFLILLIGFFLSGINFLLLAGIIGSIFSVVIFKAFLILLITKLIADFIYLFSYSIFTKQEGLMQYFLFVELLSPLYVMAIFIGSLFTKYNWKGRTGG